MARKRKQLEEEDGGGGGVEIPPPLRRSSRHGAGHGGHAAQLSNIGKALESPKKTKKRGKIEVPASEPLNALAPKPKMRGKGATKRSQAKQKVSNCTFIFKDGFSHILSLEPLTRIHSPHPSVPMAMTQNPAPIVNHPEHLCLYYTGADLAIDLAFS
jgi:hypothetical protein